MYDRVPFVLFGIPAEPAHLFLGLCIPVCILRNILFHRAKLKIWPKDNRKTNPSWMPKCIWRQTGDRLIESKNGHDNGIGDHVDLHNYDRFRSYYNDTEMKENIIKAPKFGGNKRAYQSVRSSD